MPLGIPYRTGAYDVRYQRSSFKKSLYKFTLLVLTSVSPGMPMEWQQRRPKRVRPEALRTSSTAIVAEPCLELYPERLRTRH